ncbi:serine/threonine protein kinase [Mycobacterium sp. SMC-14]|uniref:serine/threonine protein kinase n=1 Tax=Mycobacterium sp. SMC-14 TaxID=3385968 RepID=UPI00390CBEF7
MGRRRRRGYVFDDRWVVVRGLGEGGQGAAYRVRESKTGSDDWVLKELHDHSPSDRRGRSKRLARFEREIAALERVRSPHVPQVTRPPREGRMYFVTPYVGKNLHDVPDAADPVALLERFRGIVVAVRDAHAGGVVHRDIKPNNVTVNDEGKSFLVDFGICAADDDEPSGGLTSAMEALGNRNFTAPECEAGSEDACGPPSDVYSLGKLLYWMGTAGRDRRVMSREDFNPDALSFADPYARQYVRVLIDRSVRANPGSRWSVTELLEGVDWALAKLKEHSGIREEGRTVLADNFGPNDTCYESGSRSAKTGHGDPPKDYDLAHSYFVAESAVLERVDIRVARQAGSGRMEVTLIEGGDEVPSDEPEDVVEQWFRELTAPRQALEVLYLPSSTGATLGPQETYWLRLVACDNDSRVEWMSGAIELMPWVSRFADRPRGSAWTPRVSESGPPFAFRVLARPLDANG